MSMPQEIIIPLGVKNRQIWLIRQFHDGRRSRRGLGVIWSEEGHFRSGDAKAPQSAHSFSSHSGVLQ